MTLPRRRRTAAPAAALALAALVVSGCTREAAPLFGAATVEPGEVVETIAAAARIEPGAAVRLTAPAAGEVAELLVVDGQRVKAGDPLLRLDSDAVEQQLAQAKAAVRSASALGALAGGTAGLDLAGTLGGVLGPVVSGLAGVVNALEDGTTGALDATVAALAVQVGQLEAARDAALAVDPDALQPETQQLVQAAADARAALDQARTAAATARAGLDAADDALGATLDQLSRSQEASAAQAEQAARAQRSATSAQRQQAQLAVDAAEARLAALTVVAPRDGVIELGAADGGGSGGGGLDVAGLSAGSDLASLAGLAGGSSGGAVSTGPIEVGTEVASGQTLITLYDLTSFSARVDVDEIDIVKVTVGQPAIVLVDAFPDVELGGVVERIALTPERQSGGGVSYPVTVRITTIPAGVDLRVGLTASAEVEVERVASDLVVPTTALLRRGGTEVVFVVREGIARQVPVTVVAIGESTAALEGDVAPGEQVVTLGIEDVTDGLRVDVIPSNGDAP